jgi:lycopene cyclase domain-containing protein
VTYTHLALLATAAAVAADLAAVGLVRRRSFWTAYAIVLCFQLLANAWLTGRGIVRYDPGAILGWRVAFAPVEDLLFGFALVLWTLDWWVWWGRSGVADRLGRFSRRGRREPGAAGSGVRGEADA